MSMQDIGVNRLPQEVTNCCSLPSPKLSRVQSRWNSFHHQKEVTVNISGFWLVGGGCLMPALLRIQKSNSPVVSVLLPIFREPEANWEVTASKVYITQWGECCYPSVPSNVPGGEAWGTSSPGWWGHRSHSLPSAWCPWGWILAVRCHSSFVGPGQSWCTL